MAHVLGGLEGSLTGRKSFEHAQKLRHDLGRSACLVLKVRRASKMGANLALSPEGGIGA